MRVFRALLASLVLLLIAAASASATTTIGQLQPVYSGGTCAGSAVIERTVPAGTASYEVPPGGWVITSWQTKTGTLAGTAKLKVYRPTGVANEYLILAEEGPHSIAAETSPTFSGLQIPVQGGDLIGLTGSGTNCTYYFSGSEYSLSSFGISPGVDPALGTTAKVMSTTPGSGVEVQATLEADADRDGYGDEAHDPCPLDAAAHVLPCPVHMTPPAPDTTAPQLTLSAKAIQDALKQGGVKVTAKANEAAAFAGNGSNSIPSTGKSFSLAPASASAPGGTDVTLKLGLTKAARKKVKAALAGGDKVRATVHVTATDQAGNRSSANQAATVKRAKKAS